MTPRHRLQARQALLAFRWAGNLRRIAATAAVLFLLVYGSDVLLTAGADLLVPDAKAALPGNNPVWRPWAYVPVETPRVAGLVAAEEGEPVEEGRVAEARDTDNDLSRRVSALRRRLGIRSDGVMRDGMPAMPLRSLVAWVGGDVQWMAGGRAAVFSELGLLRFEQGVASVERNYNQVPLPAAPFLVGDELYLPLISAAKVWDLRLVRDVGNRLYALSRDGRELRVLCSEQAYHITIDRSDRTLEVRYAGELVKRYRICAGRGENTPLGEFRIQNKAMWPGWRAYWGEYIPGGSPRNPLGARWLGTTARGRATSRVIGIHGTNQPSSIGQRISGGCIRLLNPDIIELYEVIPVGTAVTIRE